ncbi:MAG: hypothetical protein QOI21_1926 [Actinomycetota bacterium]|jgi:hypothetical protein|nr:hypothetical protein [Actinomycetota bacterium]
MVDDHRDYEAAVYSRVEQAAKPGDSPDDWTPQSQRMAEDFAGAYSIAEEQRLKQGQEMRGDAPGPNAEYLANTHQALFDMVNVDLDVSSIDARGQAINDIGEWLKSVRAQAETAAAAEGASWQGPAAEQAHGFVNSTAAWADNAGQATWLAANRYSQQAAAADHAKNAMPAPTNFDQAAEMDKARQQMQSGTPAGLVGGLLAQQEIAQKQAQAQQAHEEAARVMHGLDTTYYATASTQPSFAPPPELGASHGGDESTKVSGFTPPPSGPGGTGSFPGGGAVGGPGGGPVGGPSSFAQPGLSGPGSTSGAGQYPGQFAGSNPGGGSGSVPRPGGLPGTSIASALGGAVGGRPGGGGDITRSPSGRGGAPRTNFAGGRVSGGGLVPKEGAAGGRLGEAGKGSGAGNVGPKEGAVGRGGAAASGKAGAAGAHGAGAGGGKGKQEDDAEHKRKYGETEDHFDVTLSEGPDGEKVVPPVIGEK